MVRIVISYQQLYTVNAGCDGVKDKKNPLALPCTQTASYLNWLGKEIKKHFQEKGKWLSNVFGALVELYRTHKVGYSSDNTFIAGENTFSIASACCWVSAVRNTFSPHVTLCVSNNQMWDGGCRRWENLIGLQQVGYLPKFDFVEIKRKMKTKKWKQNKTKKRTQMLNCLLFWHPPSSSPERDNVLNAFVLLHTAAAPSLTGFDISLNHAGNVVEGGGGRGWELTKITAWTSNLKQSI